MNEIIKAFRILNEMTDSGDREQILHINVYVEPELNEFEEELPSGKKDDVYDEQTLQDWYDFTATIEGIIENFGEIVNISMSKNPKSLSEYIDFYSFDSEGNKKNYIIDLSLSDHKSTASGKVMRKDKVKKFNSNYRLFSVVVNGVTYKSYNQAINKVREILAKDLME